MSIITAGTRITDNARSAIATRNMIVFEVLDYDSLTHIPVGDAYVDVVGLIYKKVTITHEQTRRFSLHYETETAIRRDIWFPDMPLTYLDPAPASDNYSYSGTRAVEYRLCLLVGSAKYELSLGNVITTVAGSLFVSGTDQELKEDAVAPVIEGPSFVVTGERLYGVSVNCGKQAMTYSYDIEEYLGGFIRPVPTCDSPANAEDYNDFWRRKSRMVGVINYLNVRDSKEFIYGTAGTGGLPNKVMAVGYRKQ